MLDVYLLGTSGMMPLPGRWLTSMMARYNGSSVLVDCGEGTQIAIKEVGLSFKPIDVICFTHFHADHISGLPGLLLTIGNAERKEPITLVGPKGLERVVTALRVIAPELPFSLNFIELTSQQERIEVNGYIIDAFRVNHAVSCYGYSINILRKGKFNVNNAVERGIPKNVWNKLQNGQVVEVNGTTYTPDMVMGEERKGLKVTYCTDSRPTQSIVKNAEHSDLFICEGMYGEKDKDDKAIEYKHMTFVEAANIAKEAKVSELWLTHYSPSLVRPSDYMGSVTSIFANAYPGKDGKSVQLDFEDNE